MFVTNRELGARRREAGATESFQPGRVKSRPAPSRASQERIQRRVAESHGELALAYIEAGNERTAELCARMAFHAAMQILGEGAE